MFGFLPVIGAVFGLKGKAAGIVGGIVTLIGILLLVWGSC